MFMRNIMIRIISKNSGDGIIGMIIRQSLLAGGFVRPVLFTVDRQSVQSARTTNKTTGEEEKVCYLGRLWANRQESYRSPLPANISLQAPNRSRPPSTSRPDCIRCFASTTHDYDNQHVRPSGRSDRLRDGRQQQRGRTYRQLERTARQSDQYERLKQPIARTEAATPGGSSAPKREGLLGSHRRAFGRF